MTEMFGEAWSPMSVPDLAPDDDDVWVFGYECVRWNQEITCIAAVQSSMTQHIEKRTS